MNNLFKIENYFISDKLLSITLNSNVNFYVTSYNNISNLYQMASRSKSLGKTTDILHNVDFYTGKKSGSFDLASFRKKKSDFKFLEGNHAFIQWIFPNHFSSQFNYDSYALTLAEANEFRKNLVIAKNLIESYKIMFKFYG